MLGMSLFILKEMKMLLSVCIITIFNIVMIGPMLYNHKKFLNGYGHDKVDLVYQIALVVMIILLVIPVILCAYI
jgi:hypothetical protein